MGPNANEQTADRVLDALEDALPSRSVLTRASVGEPVG